MQVNDTPVLKHRTNPHKSKSSKNSNTNNNYSSADNNNSSSRASASGNVVGANSPRKSAKDDDDISASVMSQSNHTYMALDDDHIDDQEAVDVGNLIIDLECNLEKEKITCGKAKAKSTNCSQNAGLPSSSSSYATEASFSNTSQQNSTPNSSKSNQKSSSKHSNISSLSNNVTSNSNNSTINVKNAASSSSSLNNANSNNGHLSTRTVFKSSADEKCELKMKITRETKPGKSEHKIVTSPNQKSPTSSSGANANSNATTSNYTNFCEDAVSQESISRPTQSASISSTKKECGTSTSIGTITEPDCLGPCEPGTSVTLEGIVWQETEGGILVVNVTWRGKTYVGALLDCTKHDWAPPRLCDSPASDIDSKAHKGVRTKRIVTRSNGIGLDEKNLLQTTGKLRNGKGRRILTSTDPASCNKRQRESEKSNENIAAQTEANASSANVSSITTSETACVPMNVDTIPTTNNESISTSNILTDKAAPNSPTMIGCNEPNCSKKYRNMNGLLYHQTHAHGADNDSTHAQDNCSSTSAKERGKLTNKAENDDQEDMGKSDCVSPVLEDAAQRVDIKQFKESERRHTPSPQQSSKINNKTGSESSQSTPINKFNSNFDKAANRININPGSANNNNPIPTPDPRPRVGHTSESDRRSSSNSNNVISAMDHGRRSPQTGLRHPPEHGHGSSNHSSSKINSVSSKQSNPVPLPAATEEGMKPSGTSTGPPPAPHQANCYFNPAFLANTFNPYSMPPYFPTRSPMPLYDPLTPSTTPANAALQLTRFMSSIRVPPPPESPSRLLSPSVGKNIPFPHFKVEPRQSAPLSIPVSGSLPPMTNPSLSSMNPLTNPPPPLAAGSPLLRMPSQGDPMLPPTSQPPFSHPVGLNPTMGLPGSINPMEPMGGLQVPSLVEDALAKHYPRFKH